MHNTNEIGSQKLKPEGLCFGLPFEEYRHSPGLNQTTLKQFLDTSNRKGSSIINQQACLRGNAGHCLVLESDRFHQSYVPAPQGLRCRGNSGQARWKAFADQHPGKTVLPRNLWDQLMTSERALAVHPRMSDWMSEGHGETSLFWQDPEFSLQIQVLAEYQPQNQVELVDLLGH